MVDRRFDKFFAYAFLVASLLLPRNKPYSFLLLAPATYCLLEDENAGIRVISLATIIVLPDLLLIFIRS